MNKRLIVLSAILVVVAMLFLFRDYRPRMSVEQLKPYVVDIIKENPQIQSVGNLTLAHVNGNQYTGVADVTYVNDFGWTETERIAFTAIYDRENIMLEFKY